MKIGYARVSTKDQNLDRQLVALKAEGCDLVYAEKASGKDVRNRPELKKALAALNPDDVLVVAEWDRATRSYTDGLDIMAEIGRRGALVKVAAPRKASQSEKEKSASGRYFPFTLEICLDNASDHFRTRWQIFFLTSQLVYFLKHFMREAQRYWLMKTSWRGHLKNPSQVS
ncbi:recombinase family protein [Martelella mediterranea]|uniref:Resolvase-like protein n=1 Tax=Martelella mediterranea TaxID=293089 RepID=A0A4V2V305_9HYPH|nr:recombinase family protein [Martelella mediterranea]TCT27719.1 resolvase-like protein [Martelella mediterranea]